MFQDGIRFEGQETRYAKREKMHVARCQTLDELCGRRVNIPWGEYIYTLMKLEKKQETY